MRGAKRAFKCVTCAAITGSTFEGFFVANQWFRFYSEFLSDAKVQMMPETYQRRLVMLFCMRCNGNETLQETEIAFQLRISDDEWKATKADFISRGFIDSDNRLLNWDKRQYISDSSTNRVKKHRENKVKRFRNVTVTPPEQNRTDTEQIIKDNTNVLSKKPKVSLNELSVDHIADWLAQKRSEGRYIDHDPYLVLEKFKDYCKSKGKKYADYKAAYRGAFDWDKCQPTKAGKPTWRSEGERLAAKYAAEAEQAEIEFNARKNLCAPEAIR